MKGAPHLLPVNHSGMEVWGTSMERLLAVVLILSILILTPEDNLTPPQSEKCLRASKISIPVTLMMLLRPGCTRSGIVKEGCQERETKWAFYQHQWKGKVQDSSNLFQISFSLQKKITIIRSKCVNLNPN